MKRQFRIVVQELKKKTPLLISRNALRALSAKIDFAANEMRVFPEEWIVPLETYSAGQYVIQPLGEAQPAVEPFAEVMMSQIRSFSQCLVPGG